MGRSRALGKGWQIVVGNAMNKLGFTEIVVFSDRLLVGRGEMIHRLLAPRGISFRVKLQSAISSHGASTNFHTA